MAFDAVCHASCFMLILRVLPILDSTVTAPKFWLGLCHEHLLAFAAASAAGLVPGFKHLGCATASQHWQLRSGHLCRQDTSYHWYIESMAAMPCSLFTRIRVCDQLPDTLS